MNIKSIIITISIISPLTCNALTKGKYFCPVGEETIQPQVLKPLPKKQRPLTEQKEILIGEQFSIEYKENPSTGYQTFIGISPHLLEKIKCIKKERTRLGKPGMVGTPSIIKLIFQAIQPTDTYGDFIILFSTRVFSEAVSKEKTVRLIIKENK